MGHSLRRYGLLGLLALMVLPSAEADIILVSPESDLDSVVADAPPGTVIQFTPGRYRLTPKPWLDPTCVSCPEDSTQVPVTVGLRVSGQGIWLLGPAKGERRAEIQTNAGYGILFDDCRTCTLEGLTITATVRDSAREATSAAVVVRHSSVTLVNNVIRDNVGDERLIQVGIVGVMGIAAREGANITARGNQILRNSWDGIALFRGAQANLENNIIDGIDLAGGLEAGGGRGVGISIRGNSFARLSGNLVRHYWKGIGTFQDAQVTAESNVVEHVATWGMTLWDEGIGRPSGTFRKNVIFDTGACGMSVLRSSVEGPPPGQFVQNVLVQTGQDPQYDSGEPFCEQVAMARHDVPESFPFSANITYRNREPGGRRGAEDLDARTFTERIKPVIKGLSRWPATMTSDFWREFGPQPEEMVAVPDAAAVDSSAAVDSILTAPPDSTTATAADSLTALPEAAAAMAVVDSGGVTPADSAAVVAVDTVGVAPADTASAAVVDTVRAAPADTSMAPPHGAAPADTSSVLPPSAAPADTSATAPAAKVPADSSRSPEPAPAPADSATAPADTTRRSRD